MAALCTLYALRQVHDKMLHGLMMKMHKLYRLKRASTPDLVT
jgi:hypothetical protein